MNDIPFPAGYGHNTGRADDDANPYARSGYIKIARDMRYHPVVGCGQAVPAADPDRGSWSRYEAWQDLIMECRYEPGRVYNKGRVMTIEPGQLLGAISWLASRWNWTPKTVRGFLDRLEMEGMIRSHVPGSETCSDVGTEVEQTPQNASASNKKDENNPYKETGKQKGNQARVLTISNYEIFQMWARHEGQATGQVKGKRRASEGQQLNKGTTGIVGNETRDFIIEGGVGETLAATVEPAAPAEVDLLGTAPVAPVAAAAAHEKISSRSRPKREATRLPETWQLTRKDGEWAYNAFRVTESQIRNEAARFKDFWIGKGETKADWSATWRNWCRSKHLGWTPRDPSATQAPVDFVELPLPEVAAAEDGWAEVRRQQREAMGS